MSVHVVRRMKAVLAAVLAANIFAFGTLAENAKAPTDVSIQSYGDHDKSCLAWTDSCRNCSRGTGGAPVCANIGIACQPKAIVCTEREKADKGGK